MSDLEKALACIREEIEMVDAMDGNVTELRRIEVLLMKLERLEVEQSLVSPGALAIATERRRQVEEEGWQPSHDDNYTLSELPSAAACYLLSSIETGRSNLDIDVRWMVGELWPWADFWWKPTIPRRDLVKAGALIAAEIDKRDRKEAWCEKWEVTNG